MVSVGTFHDWTPEPGLVVSWYASPASLEAASQAPTSVVPASYQHSQHLRGLCRRAADGKDMARLLIFTWNIQGICDIPTMTSAINAHVRRHDTYHSWFEYNSADDIGRRTIQDPADIEFVPSDMGEMTAAGVRQLIMSTPSPLNWNCFNFGIIQHDDYFTFYSALDHLVTDGTSISVLFLEIHMMYAALLESGTPLALPEAGSYEDYCLSLDPPMN